MTSLARVVFAALVLATLAAFFLTQRLRHTPALVQRLRETPTFSPGGPPGQRQERISFQISNDDTVTVTVIDTQGRDVATLLSGVRVHRYHRLHAHWDGHLSGGQLAPAGTYQVRITLASQGRSVVLPRFFRLVVRP